MFRRTDTGTWHTQPSFKEYGNFRRMSLMSRDPAVAKSREWALHSTYQLGRKDPRFYAILDAVQARTLTPEHIVDACGGTVPPVLPVEVGESLLRRLTGGDGYIPPVMDRDGIARDWKAMDHDSQRALLDRLFRKVRFTTGGCWEWTGARAGEYAQTSMNRRKVLVHRLIYSIMYGPVPAGLFVMHTCDNPICVNPAHLRCGTAADNATDMVNKGRSLVGERNHQATVTADDVVRMRQMYAQSGVTKRMVAEQFGVSRYLVDQAVAGRTWRHVPAD